MRGTGLAGVYAGRGAAFGDLFNDGKIDVVINQLGGPPALLRNVNADQNHWIGLKLIGGPKSPRDAVGAAVYVTAGGIRQRGDVISGGSFASSNDQRVHFGLGSSATVDAIEVRWPSGSTQKIAGPIKGNSYFSLEEGKSLVPMR